ncbi:MAG: hypothetical protein IKV55_01435 [Oscillospiraceae bacterium]|nr:hypothetical protein [Oscillospiraceae bacterium]
MNAVNETVARRPIWLTAVALVLAVAVALCSLFPIKEYATKEATFTRSIASIDERKAAVTALSAAAAAAATAVAAIPGDATTPIAEQIMEISSYLLIVVCVLVLEKSLITVVGGVAFGWLLPIACALFVVWLLGRKEWLYQLAVKLAIFALVLALIIPFSVRCSDRIYAVNRAEVETVMEQAAVSEDAAASAQETTWWQNALSAVKGGAEALKEEAQRILNRFVDAIAIFLITYCAIPVLVVMAVLWLMKMFFGVSIPVPKVQRRPRVQKSARPQAE